ncbi:hypothetical protein NOCA1130159 [metagenome]|uniref:Dynamin family protein n=1 Tax=metagenome TaxID=256318 RepID=A0A2P2C9X5_9ZZZZ
MTADEAAQPTLAADAMSRLVNETLLLTAEVRGLPPALIVRSEVRALTAAQHGRVVVLAEDGQDATDLLSALLDAPGLAATVRPLPPSHTTYRFDLVPSLTMVGPAGEVAIELDADGRPARHHEPESVAARNVVQVDVAMPSAVLSRYSITHLPDLHAADNQHDPLEAITPGCAVVLVASARQPISLAEIRFLRQVRERTERIAVVVTGVDAETQGSEVLAVNEVVLRRARLWAGEAVHVLADRDGADAAATLRHWLDGLESGRAGDELLGIVRGAIDRLLVAAPLGRAPEDAAAEAVSRSEAEVSHAIQGAMNWLPRLGYEFTRLRTDVTETVSRSLGALEQRHEDWIQRDPCDAIERLPHVLRDDLRTLQSRSDNDLAERLAILAHQFLDGRQDELVPGGLRPRTPPADPEGTFVQVAEMHVDASNELFASLGNFGSGRQSIGLLSSVVSAVAVPVALVGGVIGVGFWHLGRRSRQEAVARAQASKWLKVQLGEAARTTRFRLDQSLNEAQLILNLAAREHHDQRTQELRATLEKARGELVDARTRSQDLRSRCTALRDQAEQLMGQDAAHDGVGGRDA